MSRHLDRLRLGLDGAFGQSLRLSEWGAPVLMTKALKGVQETFDTGNVSPDQRSVARTLQNYRRTKSLPSFIDRKYACFGIAQRVDKDEWCLIEDAPLFNRLLELVNALAAQPRQFRKCYQGLMHSYFSYPILDESAISGANNWKLLQKFLNDQMRTALSAERQPTWLLMLNEHKNLLTDEPCGRYAAALMNGDASELVAATDCIGISSSSWLWQEATVAHAQAVCNIRDDAKFRQHLKPLLDLLAGKSGVELGNLVVVRCLAMVLVRYARGADRPEHPRLRDLAVERIGNPWLKRAAWDAHVADDEARKMVDRWLKRRLITDFFALLSEDGAADERRLQYWLKFDPVIDDMWFALGSYARTARSSDFKEMRMRMDGRLHYLDGQGSPYNNAFIMRIGPFMVVEFGVHGNATYIYNASDLRLDQNVRHVSIHALKASNHVARLIHNGVWESSFDAWLLPRLGWKPSGETRSATRPRGDGEAIVTSRVREPRTEEARQKKPSIPDIARVMDVIYANNLGYEDKRAKDGAFWILTGNDNLAVNAQLLKLGFTYKTHKGWWRE